MNATQIRSKAEQALDRAHRNLYWARHHAEELGDEGLTDDLWQLMIEVERLMDRSVSGRKATSRRMACVTDAYRDQRS